MNNRIIITGSGNCGTTFLIKLLSELGLDTGWTAEEVKEAVKHRPTSSFEWPVRGERSLLHLPQPYILKHPHLCFDLRGRIERWDWNVEHVYVLLREWEHVASHKHQQYFGREEQPQRYRESFLKEGILTDTEFKEYHEMKAASAIGNIMIPLVEDNIPHTFIMFPRMITDPVYLFYRLNVVLGEMRYTDFLEGFNKIADVKEVHWGLK